jgi:hypothetical protein
MASSYRVALGLVSMNDLPSDQMFQRASPGHELRTQVFDRLNVRGAQRATSQLDKLASDFVAQGISARL